MQFKKLLAVSASASIAFANNSTLTTATPSVSKACSFKDFTATASSQIASIAACATAVGDVTVQGSELAAIDITGTEEFYGDFTINDASNAASFLAPNLQLVAGSLIIENSTGIQTLNLAQLTTVGTFSLIALPELESSGLTSGLTSAEQVIIADTGLSSLEGINVYELKVFNVNNNQNIESIDSGLETVTDSINIADNAEQVEVVLDKLTSAKDISLQSITSFSLANITSINGSLSIIGSSVESVDIKNLASIGNSLTIDKNDKLDELDFPKLTKIGGALEIADNEQLSSFDGFPKLKTIGGSVTLNGTFDNGTFESLNKVAGGFTLVSDGDLTCDDFNKLNKDGDIQGDKYYCSGASGKTSSSSAKTHGSSSTASSGSSSSSSTSGSSSSSSSSKHSGAANGPTGTLMSIAAGFVAIGAALL